jgi:Tol biopolymer transport system component
LNPYKISLSQDGTRLAHDVIRLSSNIWVATLNASGTFDPGSATPVTRENQRVEVMNLSRDGQWLAYDSDRAGNFDIWKIPVGGREPIQLTTHLGNDFNPGWSPDGKHLEFHSARDGIRHIYVISSDGTGEQLIARGPGQDYMPAWSPTGDRVAFRSVTDSSAYLFVTERRADGSWTAPHVINGDSSRTWAQWSPDGASIAYGTDQGLVVAPASGGASRIVVGRAQLGGDVQGIAWPDPATIYVMGPIANGLFRTYAVSPSGLGRTSFATDGKRLFFLLATRDADIGVLEIKR